MSNGVKAIFLDRDGTINVDKGYLYKVSDFEYIKGAVEALKLLSEKEYLLFVITNQSGIARGYYTEEDYFALDKWMREDLLSKGVMITDTFFCSHLPNGIIPKYSVCCDCRKPKTKLFWEAANRYDIDMSQSFAIGDKERDLSICLESDVRGILLSEKSRENCNFEICTNWKQVVETIIGNKI